MRDLVDTVLDDFDKDYTLTGIVSETGKTVMKVEAMPSAWGYVESDGIYRCAEIIIKIHVYIDVNLIS